MAERKTRVLVCRCDTLDGPGHRYCAVCDRASRYPGPPVRSERESRPELSDGAL